MANWYWTERTSRFFASIAFLSWPLVGLAAARSAQGTSIIVCITPYLLFLTMSSILMTTIVYRLYLQHEIRKFKFDILNLVLLSALISLPLALTNGYWEIFDLSNVEDIADDKMHLLIFGSVIAVLLMPFVLFVTEALLHWANYWTKTDN